MLSLRSLGSISIIAIITEHHMRKYVDRFKHVLHNQNFFMKKIKFAAAFLALAFVIASSFTTKPLPTEYGFISRTPSPNGGQKFLYQVVNQTTAQNEFCQSVGSSYCKVDIDLSFLGAGLIVPQGGEEDPETQIMVYEVDEAVSNQIAVRKEQNKLFRWDDEP